MLREFDLRARAAVAPESGQYGARRLRTQREVIRDVMLVAADCGVWITVQELSEITSFAETSISAQLRHLRKMENGGYTIGRRSRVAAALPHGTDGRVQSVQEYRISRPAL
jgi:hypothetical protein